MTGPAPATVNWHQPGHAEPPGGGGLRCCQWPGLRARHAVKEAIALQAQPEPEASRACDEVGLAAARCGLGPNSRGHVLFMMIFATTGPASSTFSHRLFRIGSGAKNINNSRFSVDFGDGSLENRAVILLNVSSVFN